MSTDHPPGAKTDAPEETFRGHLPALAGTVTGTLIAAILGHFFFGKTGTAYALIGSSAVTGTASWWIERAIRRAHVIAEAKRKAQKVKGSPLSFTETQMIERVHKARFNWRFRGIHYRTIAVLAATASLVAFLTVLILNQLGSQPVSYQPPPAPVITRTSYVPETEPAVTYRQTPSYSFSSSLLSPSVTPTRKVSASASPTPSVIPDLSPSSSDTTGITPSPIDSHT